MENDSSVFGNTHKGRQRCCAGQRFSCSARSVKESRGSWFTAGSGGTEAPSPGLCGCSPTAGAQGGAGGRSPAASTICYQPQDAEGSCVGTAAAPSETSTACGVQTLLQGLGPLPDEPGVHGKTALDGGHRRLWITCDLFLLCCSLPK